MATLFSKIVSGEVPCHKVWEDDAHLAFLDIRPMARGHTLVIPKEAKAQLHELSDESAAALGRALPRICRAVKQVTGCAGYNVLQNNGSSAHQEVMHVHFHIIPKSQSDGLDMQWSPGSLDTDDGAALAAALREVMDE